jgi:hypothetical protein
MKKRTGMIVLGILAVVLCLGFFSIKTDKKPVMEAKQESTQGSGMAFGDMMNQLSQNMSLWDKMSTDEKKQAVTAVVMVYRNRDNIAILNTPDFYVDRISETLLTNPTVSNMDIMTMLRILAVMEYDFYNGENKDELARRILGDKAYAENQLRRQANAQR